MQPTVSLPDEILHEKSFLQQVKRKRGSCVGQVGSTHGRGAVVGSFEGGGIIGTHFVLAGPQPRRKTADANPRFASSGLVQLVEICESGFRRTQPMRPRMEGWT